MVDQISNVAPNAIPPSQDTLNESNGLKNLLEQLQIPASALYDSHSQSPAGQARHTQAREPNTVEVTEMGVLLNKLPAEVGELPTELSELPTDLSIVPDNQKLSLAELILKVMLARGAALDNQVRSQVGSLQKYTREMDNANRAQSAVQADKSKSGGGTCTFVYTNPETGKTSTMTVSQFIEQNGDSIGKKESNSDIETTLNDIGTEAQGMSQEWSTNVSATMDKDNEAWEAASNLVSSLNQTVQELVSNLK